MFDVAGTFLGLNSGGANLLTLCATHDEKENIGLRFGARYRLNCMVHAKYLLQYPVNFQDLYLQIIAPDGSDRLYALPVLVRNMQNNRVRVYKYSAFREKFNNFITMNYRARILQAGS